MILGGAPDIVVEVGSKSHLAVDFGTNWPCYFGLIENLYPSVSNTCSLGARLACLVSSFFLFHTPLKVFFRMKMDKTSDLLNVVEICIRFLLGLKARSAS